MDSSRSSPCSRENARRIFISREEDGWTLLHWAAFNGHLEVVRVLIHEFKANVNARDFFGRSPFYVAAGRGHLKIVEALSSVRAIDMNLTDLLDSTPLHESAKNGWFEAARALVGFGANVNAKDIYGATPLHYAAKRRHLDTVKILVEDGKADPYAKDNYGLTPQHWAVSDGDIEKVKAFEEKFSGDAWALHAAVEYGYVDAVHMLVRGFGFSATSRDSDGSTPLHRAARNRTRQGGKITCVGTRSRRKRHRQSSMDTATPRSLERAR